MERCSRRAWTIIPPGSSTATTGQESTVTFVMMIHTTAQCSEEILPSPQGMASTLVGRLSNPAVRSCFSKLPRTCTPWAVTGLSSAAVEYVKRLELDDPRSDFRFQACPRISSPDSRKAFRDLRVVRTPEENLRYLCTGENCLPNFP